MNPFMQLELRDRLIALDNPGFLPPQRIIDQRMRESERLAEEQQQICRRCYDTDHSRTECDRTGIVACSICYRMNVFTSNCCERGKYKEITDVQHQVFRLAGTPIPQLFVDVEIFMKNIPGLVNTGSTQTKISPQLFNYIISFDELIADKKRESQKFIMVPITLRKSTFDIKCKVEHLTPKIHLELGMDYLMQRPFEFKFDNITLNSRQSWVADSHEEFDYLYNKPKGKKLKTFLRKKEQDLFKGTTRRTFPSPYKQYFHRSEAQQ